MAAPSCSLPVISVVVPSRNQGRFLRAALESIFRQDYPRLEVVVMDGGSTDESRTIIESFAARLKYWRSRPDEGQSAAINEGMLHCTGDLVAWLNSDDFYWRDCLWTIARAYAAYPGYGLYIGNGLRYAQERDCYTAFNRRHMALDRQALEEGLDYILQPSTFVSRAAWEQVGGLNPTLQYCMDWDILIRISRKYPAVLINEFLAASREYADTKTSTGRMKRATEILEMIRRHTSREVTSGGLYYLLETLLGAAYGGTLAHVRPYLYECMNSIQTEWRDRIGNADGFPENGDSQDRTYLPFVGVGRAPSRSRDIRDLPSISVVVPSFNQANFLPQTLDSLLGQQYPRLETFVVDGGSSDGTLDVLRSFEDRLAGWVSEPDRGPAHAINKGLARTRGDVVAWVASDDVLAQDAVWEAARLFAEDPDLDLVYGNALYVNQNNQLFLADHGHCRSGLYYGEMQPYERIPAYWSYMHSVPQPTVFFRRRLLQTCGPVDESYQFIFDFELFYRFSRTAKVRKIERTQAFYRIHTGSKTSSGWDNFLAELYRFSRPLWPRRRTPEFKKVMRDFLTSYLNRRIRGRWALANRIRAACVALSVWTGWGNPEAAALRRARRATAVVTPPEGGRALQAGAGALQIDRAAVTYRSYFCSFLWPMHPGLSGGEIRDLHLLRRLLALSRVTFYALDVGPSDGRSDPLRPHVEAVYTAASIQSTRPRLTAPGLLCRPIRRRILDRLRQRGWPVLGPRYHHDGTERVRQIQSFLLPALRADLASEAPDFLFVGPQVNPTAMLLAHADRRTRLILASYDVESVRMARLATARRTWPGRLAGRLEARRAMRYERDNLALFDGVIAVSELDKQLFVERYGFPTERVLVVPNGVDPAYFAYEKRQAGAAKVVLFTGSMGYAPNYQAALRLVERIMPLVRRRHPEAVTCIVGQNPPAELSAKHDGAGVVVTGKVEDVRPYLSAAAVSCVPLLAGSGTKYKVLEALSAGVPVVCSPLGAEGLDLTDEEHLLVGRTDAELADGVARILGNPNLAAGLARRGRAQVQCLYTWDVALAGLGPWLACLGKLPLRADERRTPMSPVAAPTADNLAA
jgi:glycosyltransferase involved in cell wall biosynthesis